MRRRRRKGEIDAVHPNAGTRALYKKRLDMLLREMHRSVLELVQAVYKQNEPQMIGMAADATTAAQDLAQAMRDLASRWLFRFDRGAEELAEWFSRDTATRTDAALRAVLQRAGISVRFRMTPAARDIIEATVAQNVALIKSIPQQYLTQVEGMVMRSVQTGRDIGGLTREIEGEFGVSRRRAALIARDQNNKATSAIQKARQIELGLDRGVWIHSGGGKEPRPKHVAASGQEFDLKKGMKVGDKGQWVMPGEEINCFPGSTQIEFADGVEKAYRRRYSGQLTEIVTDSFKTLRATPNHPVLTPDGWRPIGSLYEGDQVIEIADQGIQSTPSKADVDHAVPSLAEIFEAMAKTGRTHRVISGRHHFHGDGADGDVDVVLSAGTLSFGRERLRLKGGDQFSLSVPPQSRTSKRPTMQFLGRQLGAAARFVRRLYQPFAASFAFSRHPDAVGVASVPGHSARFGDPTHHSPAVDPLYFGDREDASTTLVLPAQITRVRSARTVLFDGHVYNLQTASGWYVAEGIIAHNCRCVWRAVVPGF